MKHRKQIVYGITTFIMFFSLNLDVHLSFSNWSWWVALIGIAVIANNFDD
jgi:hypothetical protein